METDSFGEMKVPANKYYGANTARSLQNFDIGGEEERMPVSGSTNFGSFARTARSVGLGESTPGVQNITNGTIEIEFVLNDERNNLSETNHKGFRGVETSSC